MQGQQGEDTQSPPHLLSPQAAADPRRVSLTPDPGRVQPHRRSFPSRSLAMRLGACLHALGPVTFPAYCFLSQGLTRPALEPIRT